MSQSLDPFSIALAHHKAGRPAEAAALYQATLEENPGHTDALFNLGALLGAQGQFDEATGCYERVLELMPEDPDTLSNLGNVMMSRGRPAEAIAYYRRAIARNPSLAAAHANLGKACHSAGSNEEALEHYRRALELNPRLAPAHSSLGAILVGLNRRDEARRHLESAIALDPDNPEARSNYGNLLSKLGDHAAAVVQLEACKSLRPDWSRTHYNLGVALAEAGRPEAAMEAYREAVRLQPDYVEALRGGGAALMSAGATEEAEIWLNKGLALREDDVEALFYLGNLHQARNDSRRAMDCYMRALEFNCDSPEIYNNLGNSLCKLGRPDEAIEAINRAIGLRPDFAPAHNTLGNALMAKHRHEEAFDAYRRSNEIDPDLAVAANNLGDACRSLKRFDEAVHWFEKALKIDPAIAGAHNGIGLVHQAFNRHKEAKDCFEKAIELQPKNAEALNNLAVSYQEMGLHGEAVRWYRDALAANPDIAEIYFNLGSLLQGLGRHDETISVFMKALQVRPDFHAVHSFLAHSLLQQCSWRNLDAVIAATIAQAEKEIEAGEWVTTSAFALQSLPVSPELRLNVARNLARRYEAGVATLEHYTHSAPAVPKSGKLRVGYVSPDFRFHSVAVAFKGLLDNHDRERFELFGYSLANAVGGPLGTDGMTQYFSQNFDQFVDLADLPFVEAGKRLHDDRIDILVDLAGHTRGGRLELFALRPAPIQAHYLGYSATIGADYIHYLITDRGQVPPENEKYFHEKLVFLPDTFMATTHTIADERRLSREDCGLPEDGFVFANFNSHYKFDPWIFAIWTRLLRRTPGSVMWFVRGTPTSRDNLRKEAEARGVAPERLIFGDTVPHGVHLARHRHIDLALDNQIHGGGVTTVDALWMGVPVLTVAGDTPQSRNGASLLNAMALPELVTSSLDAYERTAHALAADPERLAALKAKVEANRLSEPLFDTERLTRHLERGYRMMWENHEAGRPPRTMEVPALPPTGGAGAESA